MIMDRWNIGGTIGIVWRSGRRARVSRVVRGTNVVALLLDMKAVGRGRCRDRGRRTSRC